LNREGRALKKGLLLVLVIWLLLGFAATAVSGWAEYNGPGKVTAEKGGKGGH